tara:strand:+ start:282 stop:551 length:270 start_codon:yes stop_codon:yes gene_type:complete
MKRYLASLMVLGSCLVYSGPSYSCSANHGYTKTAAAINQSSLTSERKDALAQILAKSQADHDNYTVLGNNVSMSKAVQKLVAVNRELNK